MPLRRRVVVAIAAAVAVLLAVLAACGQRPTTSAPADLNRLGTIAGRVLVSGPVNGATVTVYRLDDGARRGAVVGTGATDGAGAFDLGVGSSTGPYVVVAAGGTTVDAATGVTVPLGSAELTVLVTTFEVETHLDRLAVTPVSHLAAGLALHWVTAEAKTLAAADAEAWQHLDAHFGALDWRTATPSDVTSATGALLDDGTKAGLLLAAWSMEARLISEADALTPGGRVTPLTLVEALYDDVAADGYFDGIGSSGHPTILPPGGALADAGPTATRLDGQSLRTAYAQGVAKFLGSDRNVTRVSLTDAQQLISAIATNDDARIFRAAAQEADIEPPTITWVKPAKDHAGVRGSVDIEVRAADNVAVKSFSFTAPSTLALTAATTASDGRTLVLKGTLDVSSLADGPLPLTVKAVDTSNNETTSTLTVTISNHGPTITVSNPGDGSTVRGLLAISAAATAQAGAIAKLELVTPPLGVGNDTLPAADSLGATWNTLLAPEGLVTLTFHAEDTLGGFSDLSVAVTVDNVPFGAVRATASLGAPVGGLAAQLVAIDDTTGLPLLGRAGGSVLGQTAATSTTDTKTGVVAFTLTEENYEGPVQLVLSGSAATFIDPTDPNLTIALSSTFTVTSYVAHYRAGDALDIPADGWTTLADAAALAYAQGHNPASSSPIKLSQALPVTDPLFPGHLSRPSTWGLRSVVPVSLTTGSQSLRDGVLAALPDVGLNQLARDIALDVGLTPGAGYGLPHLLTALRQDLTDGVLDGKYGQVQLVTGGSQPYAFDANTTRFKLAIAMDQFVRSSQNKTGIVRGDLQTSGIDDNVCSDTSLLYPQGTPTIPFDAVPPTVNFAITFANGALSAQAPVGASKLVAGTLTLVADAVDSSGVASLGVTVGGQPLSAGPGSTASHFVATVDSKAFADGALAITANTCDRLSNCGPSSSSLTVDNTPPTITLAKPLAGYYAGPFDLDATANDNYSLASFDFVAPASAIGLVDGDSAVGHLVAAKSSWSIQAAVADGSYAVPAKACDSVGNCATSTATVTLDRTAPAVTNVSGPTSINQHGATVTATITDSGSGLAQAKANIVTSLGTTSTTGACTGSSCTFNVALQDGSNGILIWGVDAVGNGTSPVSPQLTIMSDTLPPDAKLVAAADSNAGTYYSEKSLTVAKAASGLPVMPVAYQYPAKTAIGDNSTILKLRSKSGPADDNVPVARFKVTKENASITSAHLTPTWSLVTVDGSSPPSGASISGSLTPSSLSDTASEFWDLRIVPGVPGELTYSVRFDDAAGNPTTLQFHLSYHYVGAPLVVVADPMWSPTSAIYGTYFGATSRTQKLTVYNPNAEAVWFNLAATNWQPASWTETWQAEQPVPYADIAADGQTWPYSAWWFTDQTLPTSAAAGHSSWECGPQTAAHSGGGDCVAQYGASQCTWKGVACAGPLTGADGRQAFPCPTPASLYPVHYFGNSDPGTYFACEDASAPGGLGGANAGSYVTNAITPTPGWALYANASAAGGETTPAATAKWGNTTAYLIPPALSANNSSAVAAYATMSLPARATTGLARQTFPLSATALTSATRFHDAYFYLRATGGIGIPTPQKQFAAGHCNTWACLDNDTEVLRLYNNRWYATFIDRRLVVLAISQKTAAPTVITTAPCLTNGDCSATSESSTNADGLSVGIAVSKTASQF